MPINSFDTYPLTWKPDKSQLKPPYYLSLAEDLERKIRDGLLQAGTRLPPQREIADYLDLNYTTITRVYNLCKKKGLIYGETGKGTFVAPHSCEDVTIAAGDGSDTIIEMGSVNGFSEYSDLTEKATRAVIEKGFLRNLYEYSFPTGHPHQLEAAVRWMEQLGVHTDREHSAIFSGAQNALTVALISLFSPGDQIAVDAYTYSNFIELAKMLHLVLIPVQGDEQGMLPEELDRQCRLRKIKGIYLIPTLANPTTITIGSERRKKLADRIRENRLILIEDDISTWLTAGSGPCHPSFFDLLEKQSIYICGMTKSLCPGLRIAYMTFGDEFKEAILHGLMNINIKTSSLDAEIITELLNNGDAYTIAAKKRDRARENSRLFDQYFPEIAGQCESGSYYRWLPIPASCTFKETENELTNRGVRVYHSDRFAVMQNDKQAFLRISLCSAKSRRKFERGLQILRAWLTEKSL